MIDLSRPEIVLKDEVRVARVNCDICDVAEENCIEDNDGGSTAMSFYDRGEIIKNIFLG